MASLSANARKTRARLAKIEQANEARVQRHIWLALGIVLLVVLFAVLLVVFLGQSQVEGLLSYSMGDGVLADLSYAVQGLLSVVFAIALLANAWWKWKPGKAISWVALNGVFLAGFLAYVAVGLETWTTAAFLWAGIYGVGLAATILGYKALFDR